MEEQKKVRPSAVPVSVQINEGLKDYMSTMHNSYVADLVTFRQENNINHGVIIQMIKGARTENLDEISKLSSDIAKLNEKVTSSSDIKDKVNMDISEIIKLTSSTGNHLDHLHRRINTTVFAIDDINNLLIQNSFFSKIIIGLGFLNASLVATLLYRLLTLI